MSTALILLLSASACSKPVQSVAETADGRIAGTIDTAADVVAIQAMYAGWRSAVEASNIDGYIAILDDEIRLLPPGAPGLNGTDNYREFLGPVFASATYEIQVDRLQEVEVVGNTAIAEYDYTIALKLIDPQVGISEPGALTDSSTSARYFDVLRKDANGDWKVWRHSWQSY